MFERLSLSFAGYFLFHRICVIIGYWSCMIFSFWNADVRLLSCANGVVDMFIETNQDMGIVGTRKDATSEDPKKEGKWRCGCSVDSTRPVVARAMIFWPVNQGKAHARWFSHTSQKTRSSAFHVSLPRVWSFAFVISDSISLHNQTEKNVISFSWTAALVK